jgi:hypothetical protein
MAAFGHEGTYVCECGWNVGRNPHAKCGNPIHRENAMGSSNERSLLDETRKLLRQMRDDVFNGGTLTGRSQRAGEELIHRIDDVLATPETNPEPTVESFDMRASYDAAKGLEASATFKGDAVKAWCVIAVDWFREVGGKSFVSMDMTDPRDGEHYTMTIQRAGGKTPAQEIAELKEQLAGLTLKTNPPRCECQTVRNDWCPVHGKSSASPDAPTLAALKPASSTGSSGEADPVCGKHGVTLAFPGDECWACKEES